jgi:hypothetical protein
MKIKHTILLLSIFCLSFVKAQTVTHFAGIAYDATSESFQEASTCTFAQAHFCNPEALAFDASGNLWITEKNKIRLLYKSDNKFYNRAGTVGPVSGTVGYLNGTGIQTAFFSPGGITFDASGNIFIADINNHAIRKITPFVNTSNGQSVTTFAGKNATGGTGETGIPGTDDGTGHAARFDSPTGIVRDSDGTFYVTDNFNATIRKITASGVVTTLAGKALNYGSTDGTGANARFDFPYGIAVLDANYLVVTDGGANGTIRKVHKSTGEVITIAGKVGAFSQVDGTLKNQSTFFNPKGVSVVDGKIYVCDRYAVRIVDISANKVSLFAGSYTDSDNKDGEAGAARFGELFGMTYDGKITLYVTDQTYNVIKTVRINTLAPTVNFSVSNDKPVINDTKVLFSNTSTGKPATSLTWSISPSDYSLVTGTLTSLTPIEVKFSATGFFTVTLDVVNAYGTGTQTKNNYIKVSTIGIEQISEDISLDIFPNPSTGLYTLQSLYGNYPIQDYVITDLTGKQIFSKQCHNSTSEIINLTSFNSGLYIITVKTSIGTKALKIQKI